VSARTHDQIKMQSINEIAAYAGWVARIAGYKLYCRFQGPYRPLHYLGAILSVQFVTHTSWECYGSRGPWLQI